MTVPEGTGRDSAALKARYEAGESVRGISAATGLAFKTVHRRLQAAGTRFRPPGGSHSPAARPAPLRPDDIRGIIAAYTADGGLSLNALGARYGRSGDAIARVLRRAGVEIRPRGRAASPAPENSEVPGPRGRQLPEGPDLAIAYARAASVRALAATLHASEDRIRQALAEACVPAGSLRQVPAVLRERAARLAASGASADDLAAIPGMPAGAAARLGRPAGGAQSPFAA